MAATSLLAGAIHILCFVANTGEEGTTSDVLAGSLKTNPVVVRRILKSLEKNGLVKIRSGRKGGVKLRRSADKINMADVYKAIGSGGRVFALRRRGDPACHINSAVKDALTSVFENANRAVQNSLRRTKLSTLVKNIR